MVTLKKIDHIGIMVKDLESSLRFYRDRLGLPLVGIRDNLEYKVRMASLSLGETMIDLVNPLDDSPLRAQLNEKGEGLHHICFEVANLKEVLDELDKSGVPLLFKEPLPGGDGTLVGHVNAAAANNVPIELKEKA